MLMMLRRTGLLLVVFVPSLAVKLTVSLPKKLGAARKLVFVLEELMMTRMLEFPSDEYVRLSCCVPLHSRASSSEKKRLSVRLFVRLLPSDHVRFEIVALREGGRLVLETPNCQVCVSLALEVSLMTREMLYTCPPSQKPGVYLRVLFS